MLGILKIAVFAVAGVMLALLFRQNKAEYSALISIAVCAGICMCLLLRLETVLDCLDELRALVHVDGVYLETVLKMLGITYITQFAADVCKDAGYSAVSGQIELFAKISILFLSFPVLLALVKTIGEAL